MAFNLLQKKRKQNKANKNALISITWIVESSVLQEALLTELKWPKATIQCRISSFARPAKKNAVSLLGTVGQKLPGLLTLTVSGISLKPPRLTGPERKKWKRIPWSALSLSLKNLKIKQKARRWRQGQVEFTHPLPSWANRLDMGKLIYYKSNYSRTMRSKTQPYNTFLPCLPSSQA